MKTFRDRVSVVTGAASGIGRALAVELARAGAHLAISDIDESGLGETRAQCEAVGARVSTRPLDVANREAVYSYADDVAREFGAVHMVINNAGVGLTSSLRRTSHEDFEWLMNINFWGVVHGSLAFLPHIERGDEGHIVNISSVFGIIAAPLNGPYNAAKFAVRGFTEALRMELEMEGGRVGVTCVHPGGIKTNIARSARLSSADGFTREQVVGQFHLMGRTTPESCARTILGAVRENEPRVLVGADAVLIDKMQRLSPTGYHWAAKRLAMPMWKKRTSVPG